MLANPYRQFSSPFFSESKASAPAENQLLLSLVVGNRPGVLGRIALVFSRRGFNIEYLNVQHTLDRRFSHMAIMCQGSVDRFQEIVKQCQKIVDVIQVTPVHHDEKLNVRSEQGLRLEIICNPEHKKLILQCVQYSSFQIIDFYDDVILIEKSHQDYTDEAMLTILKLYAEVRSLDTSLPLETLRGRQQARAANSNPVPPIRKGAAL